MATAVAQRAENVTYQGRRLGRRPNLPAFLRLPASQQQSSAGDNGQQHVLALPHPDWLQQTVTFTGPGDQLDALREAARGDGFVPWHIDYDRLEEDWVYRLHPGMKLAAAKILARQLRDAVWEAHQTAHGRRGMSKHVPFDLNALIPVPLDILRQGYDAPAAVAWCWENWGTTWGLRRVEEAKGQGWRVRFFSADWTPWTVLQAIADRWTDIRSDVKVDYL
jgi:hypothetical protein